MSMESSLRFASDGALRILIEPPYCSIGPLGVVPLARIRDFLERTEQVGEPLGSAA